MQLANLTLRLGGSLLNTVPIVAATPAEILVLQHIHGPDAVVDVRPGKFDRTKRHADEYERLANKYDRAAQASAPGEEGGAIMGKLFPGAMKKLPTTLKEVGYGHLETAEAKAAAKLADAAVRQDEDAPASGSSILPDLDNLLDGDGEAAATEEAE